MTKREASKVKVGDRLRSDPRKLGHESHTVAEIITESDDSRIPLPLFRMESGQRITYRLLLRGADDGA
ncbi:MAG: hypothetical protein KAI25_09760 [Hyphomicrobiaceae bacterium]|nr:hypothetical protein [Hyphomicrobiaceae bacterium]